MAEMIKGRKLTLREILDEIAEDEAFSDEILDEIAEDEEFSDEERNLARDKSKQLDTESRIHGKNSRI